MGNELPFILLGLIFVIGLPVMAISAFVMALGLRRRVLELENRLRWLAPGVAPIAPVSSTAVESPVAMAPEAAPAQTQEVPPIIEAVQTEAGLIEPPVSRPVEPVAAAEAAPVPPRRVESFEEKIGARWAVWVGGVALALGGLFLVRYSIEAGLLGPEARTILGFLFSLGLLAAGEGLRRRDSDAGAGDGRAYIPGVLTAAGTVALFGTVYAAYALYGFIGPAPAFVLLGVIGVGTMVLAALHGPGLAALGLVGAYGTPFLVSSHAPEPWGLTAFLAAVTAASFGVARLRLWRWLALAATATAFGWGVLMAGIFDGSDMLAVLAYAGVLAALVLGFLVVDVHRGTRGFDGFDTLALGAVAAVALLALLVVKEADFTTAGLAVAVAIAVGILAVALLYDAVAPAAALAAALVLGLAILWPVVAQSLAEPIMVIPDLVTFPAAMPDAASLYAVLIGLFAAGLFSATTLSLLRGLPRAVAPALALALAGTSGPLLLLATAYYRLTAFTPSLVFGAIGVGSAALLAATTSLFLRSEADRGSAGDNAAASLHAAAATAALALGMTMTLAGSTLTFAFALSALGAAWVAMLRPLPALRWAAVTLTALVMVRSGGSWTVAGEVFRTFPTWSDIALRYALPAVAVGVGGLFLRRRAVDAPAAFLDGASIVLGAAAAALSIRLWIAGPEDALSAPVGLVEAGLYVVLALGMSIGFARGALVTSSIVHRVAAPLAAVGAVWLAAVGPIFGLNPILHGGPVDGGLYVNALLIAYALPALMAVVLHALWSRMPAAASFVGPSGIQTIALGTGAAGLVLALLYLTIETRLIMRSGDVSYLDVTTAESYAYSAVWLMFSIALLAGGLALSSKGARLASALVMLLTVAKVFLVDMSDLEGVWRALSFIGLGVALIGIGLVYQRVLFGAKGGSAPTR